MSTRRLILPSFRREGSKIDVEAQMLEHPHAVDANVVVVISAQQPSGFLNPASYNGRRHDQPPFSGRGIAVDLDDGIQRKMSGEDNLAGDTLEVGLDRRPPDMLAERFTFPDRILGEEGGDAGRIIVVVAIGAISIL